jgi:hypothetical protein
VERGVESERWLERDELTARQKIMPSRKFFGAGVSLSAKMIHRSLMNFQVTSGFVNCLPNLPLQPSLYSTLLYDA